MTLGDPEYLVKVFSVLTYSSSPPTVIMAGGYRFSSGDYLGELWLREVWEMDSLLINVKIPCKYNKDMKKNK